MTSFIITLKRKNSVFILENSSFLCPSIFIAGHKAVFFYSTNKDFRRAVSYLLIKLEEECVIIEQNLEMYIADFMPIRI